MDVKIGVANSQSQIIFESDQSQKEIIKSIESAKDSKQMFVTFTDVKETVWYVSVEAIIFVEFTKSSGRKVGFVS